MLESDESIARDIAAVARIDAVPAILRLICQNTGMGFATVARVSDTTWTACAVQDDVNFGLKPGGQLELRTTLCFESRGARVPIVIDDFSQDPAYFNHHTPRIYKLGSYISVPIVLPDGTYFGNLCAIDGAPAQLSKGKILGMFEVFASLIALQLSNERRHDETAAALLDERETAKLREEFIAVLGHDLRNPLSAVSATGDLLSLRQDDPNLVRIGQRLRATTQRMSRLIDDLMDFARGRLGTGIGISIQPRDNLGDMLRAVVTELRDANPTRLVIDRIDVTQRVYCDPPRIEQLLSNLLGNALTHGTPDFPTEVAAALDIDDLVLSVRNGGEPISPETLPKVFEPYWRPAHSERGGGLGLGLYICKQIVSAHGGTLEVKSTRASGTVFTARIPMRDSPERIAH